MRKFWFHKNITQNKYESCLWRSILYHNLHQQRLENVIALDSITCDWHSLYQFTFTAIPTIRPAFYWSFYVLNNGTIPGSPSFTTYGNPQVDNEGLLFDGVSSYIGAHMHSDDALVYPERFTKGFSFGLKVKLPDSVKDYTTPRYILDSGAKSLSSRGVSLYLLEKRLVCEIASSDFMWKVGLITLTGMIVFVIVHFLLYCTEYFYILLNITSHYVA